MRIGNAGRDYGWGYYTQRFLPAIFTFASSILIRKRIYRVSGSSTITYVDKVLLSSSSDLGSALSNYVLKSNILYSIPTNKQFLSSVDNTFLFFMFVFYACYAS